MDDVGLQRVVISACSDLRWARARYASQTGIKWDRVIKQLNQDIIAANDFLPDDKQVGLSTRMGSGSFYCVLMPPQLTATKASHWPLLQGGPYVCGVWV